MTKRLLKALRREPVDRPPFWFMRQAGRYLPEYRAVRATCDGFLDLCYTPEKACEVTLQPIRRFSMDAAILFSDILVIPDALGQAVRFVQGEGPKLDRLEDAGAIDALRYDPNHLKPVYETVARLHEALPKETALIGFSGSPWTLACYMIEGGGSKDFARTRRFAIEQPEAFARLIGILEAAIVDYLSAQVMHGAEVVQLFDSWAGILPEPEFDRWVIAPTARIVAALKAQHPDIPIIGFPRLGGVGYARFAAGTGVDAVSLDPQVPLQWAADELASHVVLQGSLDPLLLLANPAAMLAQANRIRTAWRRAPSIFNLGHGFVPETPIAHVEALVELLKTPVADE